MILENFFFFKNMFRWQIHKCLSVEHTSKALSSLPPPIEYILFHVYNHLKNKSKKGVPAQDCSERLLLNHKRCWDPWPMEEKTKIRGQRQGLIAQSFCVMKFY